MLTYLELMNIFQLQTICLKQVKRNIGIFNKIQTVVISCRLIERDRGCVDHIYNSNIVLLWILNLVKIVDGIEASNLFSKRSMASKSPQ